MSSTQPLTVLLSCFLIRADSKIPLLLTVAEPTMFTGWGHHFSHIRSSYHNIQLSRPAALVKIVVYLRTIIFYNSESDWTELLITI